MCAHNKFGVAFLWGEKDKCSLAFQPFLFIVFPNPHSPLHTHTEVSAWVCVYMHMNTHMCVHTHKLRALCSSPQVSALSSAGGVENLILLEQEKHRPHEVGSVQWAGSTFGPMQKSRLGEHEFEALMRMLDNLVSLLPLSFEASPLRLSTRTSRHEAVGGHQNCQHHSYFVKASLIGSLT